MNRRTRGNDPTNGLIGEFKDPFKSKPYVDPLKRTKSSYKDPLRAPKGEYKDPVKHQVNNVFWVFLPVPGLGVYVAAWTAQYIWTVQQQVTLETEETKVKLPEHRPYNSYHEYVMPDIDPLTGKPRRRPIQRTKKQEEPKAAKQPLSDPYFPPQLGSSVGSMKRTFMIQEYLKY